MKNPISVRQGNDNHEKVNASLKRFVPSSNWAEDLTSEDRIKIKKQSSISKHVAIDNDNYWGHFREKNFQSERINLNPGTLGTTSTPVKEIRNNQYLSQNTEGFPLGSYEHARESHSNINTLCSKLWPSEGYQLTVTPSTSQTVNLLALSLIRKLYSVSKPPFKVFTTMHEHEGGIGCFHNLPEFEVHYIDDDTLADPDAMALKLMEVKPQLAFFSHVFYDTGIIANVEEWMTIVNKTVPGCKIILDAAQSLGLYNIPFGKADVVVTSTHKWLCGPQGGGLTWMKTDFSEWLGGIFWSGHGLGYNADVASLSIPGGQDFQMYPAIEEALRLFKQSGQEAILARSSYLRSYFQKSLQEILMNNGIEPVFLNSEDCSPVISLAFTDFDPYPLYNYLNDRQIHTKCIKNHAVSGAMYHILRIGIPYFETKERLDYALSEIEQYLAVNVTAEIVIV